MNCCRETVEMAVIPDNRPAVSRDWIRGVLDQYVAGFGTRGRPEERSDTRSQQATREIFGLHPSYHIVVECEGFPRFLMENLTNLIF